MNSKTALEVKDKEQTFDDGINLCISLTEETIKLWLRGYFDKSETVEDILDSLIRRMKELR